MIWGENGWMGGAQGITAGNISDITTNQLYIDAVDNLWLKNTPDVEGFWQFVPFIRPLDWVRSGTNVYAESDEKKASSLLFCILCHFFFIIFFIML